MKFPDLNVTIGDDYVATVEIDRPPHNYFDHALIAALADCFTSLDNDENCRAIMLCANGKSFCAGANFTAPRDNQPAPGNLYEEAVRLFSTKTPIVYAPKNSRTT